MWDYLELTQKGYSKAFEPVNELLTQVSTFIGKLNIEEGKLEDTGGVNFHWETQWGVRSEAKSGIERKKQFAKNHPRSCFSTNPTFAAYIRDGRRALQTGGRRLRGLKFFPFFLRLLAIPKSRQPGPEPDNLSSRCCLPGNTCQVLRDQIAASAWYCPCVPSQVPQLNWGWGTWLCCAPHFDTALRHSPP